LAALDRAVARGLAGLETRPARLTATAGTAASLAALLLGCAEYRPDELNNLAVTRDQLERETARLAAMDLRSRRSALALEPKRAEIILGGLAILRGLVDIFGLTRFTVMDAGLLEGILLGDGFAPTAGG
jgi:exopolyphosphatase/guanosine-5'-triphosphate,3'-diphosphate pyrophosphatase